MLLRQSTQAIDEVTRVFDLSAGERQFLLSADHGQGLLSTGTTRVAFQGVASELEDALCTTSPEFLTSFKESESSSGHSVLSTQEGDPGWVEL